jgi:PBP1b-binding outer membrane lipoprotein LpoB
MRILRVSTWLRVAMIPALLISSALFLSGCSETAPDAAGPGSAPIGPLAKDKKAMEQSKAAMLKSMSQNK